MDNIHSNQNINEIANLLKQSYKNANSITARSVFLFTYIEMLYEIKKYNIDMKLTKGDIMYVSFVKNEVELYNPNHGSDNMKISKELNKIRQIRNEVYHLCGENWLNNEYKPLDPTLQNYLQIEKDSDILL